MGRPTSPALVARILRAALEEQLGIAVIMERFGCSRSVLTRLLAREGLRRVGGLWVRG